MTALLDALINVLGKPAEAATLESFNRMSLQRPVVEIIGDERFFSYPSWGIMLTSYKSIFDSIRFHMDSTATRAGVFKPYKGELPFGIKMEDSYLEVQRKVEIDLLKSQPLTGTSSSGDFRVSYIWQQLQLNCTFDGTVGNLNVVSIVLI